MQRKILFITVIALVLVGSAFGTAVTERPVPIKIKATLGTESGIMGQGGNGYPATDSAYVVCENIDYGGDFNSPTAYTPERHIAFGQDTYFCIWEWGDSRNNDVTESHWESFGPLGYWTPPISMNHWGTNCGRPSIIRGNDERMIAAWHQTETGGQYHIYVGYLDPEASEWTPFALTDTTTANTETFPSLAKTSDGRIWVAYNKQIGSGPEYFVAQFSDDNGETWSGEINITPNPLLSGWAMVTLAADPTNGEVWAAYHDTLNATGSNVVVQRYDSVAEEWGDRDLAASGYPGALGVLPSIAVDSNHELHIVFQVNPNTSLDGTLMGYNYIGPSGVLKYTHGTIGNWIEPEVVTGIAATDSATGMPSLGVDARDNLYLTYAQIDSSDGQYFYNTFNAYLSVKRPDGNWEDRIDVSKLGDISAADSFAVMFPHITQEVPEAGPGICWSELINAQPPSRIMFNSPTEAKVEGSGNVPGTGAVAVLEQNQPNPFNPVTTIGFTTTEASDVNLSVFDISGKLIKVLVNGRLEAGSHKVVWNGENEKGSKVASGVYFSRLTVGDSVTTRSMMLLK